LCGKTVVDGSFGETGHCIFLLLGQMVKENTPHVIKR
jgi:hypothetical protein